MARPHIDFIQPQLLTWRHHHEASHRKNTEVKVLSYDDEDGAASLLLRYPVGWRGTGDRSERAEEVFVLEGTLELNGQSLTKGSYAYWPVGSAFSGSTQIGAVALTFLSGRSTSSADNPIAKIDTRAGGWEDNKHFPGRVLFLRYDQAAGDMTYLQTTRPNDGAGRVESHPVVQEMYMLEGELSGPLGIYQPGAYFWRPANVKHGPFGTSSGCLFFMRSLGGPLTYEYYPVEHPFTWDPTHRPILPPALASLGRPWRRSPNN